jgi:hypothetical protein
MKRSLREWMPLIASVALVAVPLLLFGLHWRWLPPGFCGPVAIPFPMPY